MMIAATRDGSTSDLSSVSSEASAVAWDRGQVLVAVGGEVRALGPDGAPPAEAASLERGRTYLHTRPQPGQETTIGVNERSPIVCRISW